MGNQPVLYTTTVSITEGYTESVAVLESEPIELLDMDTERQGFIIYNESGVLFIRFGDEDVTKDTYTYRLTSNSTFESNSYKGRVTAIKEKNNSIIQLSVMRG